MSVNASAPASTASRQSSTPTIANSAGDAVTLDDVYLKATGHGITRGLHHFDALDRMRPTVP